MEGQGMTKAKRNALGSDPLMIAGLATANATDPLVILSAVSVFLFLMVLRSLSPEQQRRRAEKVRRIAEREREAQIRRAAAIIRTLNEHLGIRPNGDEDRDKPA